MILTRTGRHFSFDPPWNFDIEDIAASLAKLCRFTGHTSDFYSVAQHSVYVSELVPKQYALHGLLHDASEAYLGDVSAPLKRLLPDYRMIEGCVQNGVRDQFGLHSSGADTEVRRADLIMLMTERRDFMPASIGRPDAFWPDVKPLEGERLKAWSWEKAEHMFLERFRELTL